MSQEQFKREVADAAVGLTVAWLRPNDILGVGTGTTVNYFIESLGKRDFGFRGAFSSSVASTRALNDMGIPVLDPNCGERAALYVDGADEVDYRGVLIKGGGGALTREKIIAVLSDSFVCIVDESKLVARLGLFPLPIEVIPMAIAHVSNEIAQLGGSVQERQGFRTDNGNAMLDVENLRFEDPGALERCLNHIPGVVENGVFWSNRPGLTLVGSEGGVEVRGTRAALRLHAAKLRSTSVSCQTTYASK